MGKKRNIFVFCAHPDDEVFGVGGAAAKYARSGFRIVPIIFSFGESSHPWLLKRYIVRTRFKECKRAGKVIGYEDPVFLGLSDGKIKKQAEERKIVSRLRGMISKDKPVMIFTHSINDPHPDHRSVYNITSETIKNFYNEPVYSFDIWNPISLLNRDAPKLYVDVTDTFKYKISALKLFKSQATSLVTLMWSVYVRALFSGFQAKCKYAERFTKVN